MSKISPTDSQYTPPKIILERYAKLLIDFALGSGEGIKPGEVIQCVVPDVAKPLGLELQNAILRSGGHPIIRLIPTGFDHDYLELASEAQLTFFPEAYLKARTELVDHSVSIIADPEPFALADIDPAKFMLSRNSKKPLIDWLNKKESAGKYTWTGALWGTQAQADIVGLSLEDYWQQIISACYLDQENPIEKWRQTFRFLEKTKQWLNDLQIQSVHAVGEDMDITVKLGSNRIWNAGSGRNMPSFEIFTSPDWRGTNGWVRFNQPVYRYGKVMKDVRLVFKDGIVVEAEAKVGNDLLQEMLKTANANKLGEYSLTDARMSRITHIMAETLFDENIGGKFGNSHLALGRAFEDCYRGDPAHVSRTEWEEMGFNNSAEHTDIVSTTNRTVTATLPSGEEVVIYQDGQFVLPAEVSATL